MTTQLVLIHQRNVQALPQEITSSKCTYIDRVTVDYSYYFGLDLSMSQENAAFALEILSSDSTLPALPYRSLMHKMTSDINIVPYSPVARLSLPL